MARTLYLAWTQFQRRQQSMAEVLPIECVFLPRRGRRRLASTVVDYCRLFLRTLSVLRQHRPEVLWIQVPPLPLLWVALWYRRFNAPEMRLVGDCHNATFAPRWRWVPLAFRMLSACDLVIVHNEDMRARALSHGIDADRLLVLEDVPASATHRVTKALPTELLARPRPWILVPGSFAADEPVNELLQAAKKAPDWTFVLTGRTENAARHGHRLENAPPNVYLPGYVETAVFDSLMQASDLVLALTRHDGIQLSACNEALGFGKAIVISDTPLLRRMFGKGARMADSSDPDALLAQVAGALADRPVLEMAARELAAERLSRWLVRIGEGPPWLTTSR